jgi:hypothetical protein
MSNKYRDGMFIYELHKPDPTNPNDVHDCLTAKTPKGRVAKLKEMARQVNISPPELEQAESMADEGLVAIKRLRLFKDILVKAEKAIQNEAIRIDEAYLLPLAARGEKVQKERRDGGLNSHGLSEEERKEMYAKCQLEINQLCLEKGHSYLRACELVAGKISEINPEKQTIHKDTIRKNTTNPYK